MLKPLESGLGLQCEELRTCLSRSLYLGGTVSGLSIRELESPFRSDLKQVLSGQLNAMVRLCLLEDLNRSTKR